MNLASWYPRGRAAWELGRRLRSRPLTLERLEERSLLSYTVTDLGTFGGAIYAEGINNAGQVVGSSELSPFDANGHAFLWERGVLSDLQDARWHRECRLRHQQPRPGGRRRVLSDKP
jgi:probable HAF family extracellular repeat protein